MQRIGCSAKMPYRRLEGIVQRTGLSSVASFGRDAPVCAFNERYVASIDTILPVTDDLYTFGRMAVAHAAADIYATGATPKHANISLQALHTLSDDDITRILEGARDELYGHDIEFGKGHTILGDDTSMSVSLIGERRLPQEQARTGIEYAVLLSKPLGLTAAYLMYYCDNEKVEAEGIARLLLQSNKYLCEILEKCVEGTADVTGYGLYITLLSMAERNGLALSIEAESIPLIASPYHGVPFTCLYANNIPEAPLDAATLSDPERLKIMLFSGEICGPFAMIVKKVEQETILSQLHQLGFNDAKAIGTAITGTPAVKLR